LDPPLKINDPTRLTCDRHTAQVRLAACRPHAPVEVGLIVNPRARRLRGRRARTRLSELLPAEAVMQTRDLASLRRALATLLVERAVNVLAIAGGDGTVHHTINALLELNEEASRHAGQPLPLPRLLLLNGGTLNIVGRTMQVRGPPERRLKRFLRAFDGALFRQVPARRMPMMLVQCGTERPRYGFVFGSEVLHHSIELYTRFGAGYSGLSRFLFELSRGALTGSDLWRDESWKLGPFGMPLRVDSRTYPTYAAVVASTVDLTLAIGRIRAIRRHELAPGFFAKVITETQASRVVKLIPALVSEAPATGISDHPTAISMSLHGPITLDGEVFGDTALPRERLPVEVTVASQRLHGVPGELGSQRW
jgi:diacylglycerol kinase (ATP)